MVWAMAALVVILMALIAWGDVKLMLGFLAVVVLMAAALLTYDYWADRESASLIPYDQIELQGFAIRPLAGAVYELTGRVQNHAEDHDLLDLDVRILAQDCTETEPLECITIGETLAALHTDVPAGQARDIKEKVLFKAGRPHPKAALRWRFEVVSTRAD